MGVLVVTVVTYNLLETSMYLFSSLSLLFVILEASFVHDMLTLASDSSVRGSISVIV
jgi:hypothetical protein